MWETKFVNYAHRGASEYVPENTLLAFYTGIYMGANGIETDVRRTKDGVLVLFHDATLERMTGATGGVEDFTYDELRQLSVMKNGYSDRIVKLEEFLSLFAFRDLTFAIELKGKDVEEDTAELLRVYGMEKKAVVTSFDFEAIRRFRQYAPEFEIGYLAKDIDEELIARLKEIGAEEICPKAKLLTKELVDWCRDRGFRVRAWGVTDEAVMRHAVECGVDGMTVNFPDRLREWIEKAK